MSKRLACFTYADYSWRSTNTCSLRRRKPSLMALARTHQYLPHHLVLNRCFHNRWQTGELSHQVFNYGHGKPWIFDRIL